jgi:DNA-binding beta-propeller fold protein YncE
VGDAYYPPRIQVFSATGAYLRGWELYDDTDLDRLAAPYGLAVDGDGNLFVGERNSRLEVFTTDGTFLRRWPLVGESYGVAVGPNGLIYVSTLSEERIQVFTPEGTLLREWGSHGTEPGQFYQPFGVAVSRSGVVYVADRYNFRVQMFTEDGLLLGQFGSEGSGPGEFLFPYGVAVGGATAERIYVSDPYNNCRVSVFGSVPTPANAASWGRIKTLYR